MKIRDEIRWIRRHGYRAWLTWATVEQACGAPLTRSQRFWRWMFTTAPQGAEGEG